MGWRSSAVPSIIPVADVASALERLESRRVFGKIIVRLQG
jgi:hypothetical protein